MPDLYEIQIVACTTEGSNGNIYRADHRFPTIPSVQTLIDLKDEAASIFEALHNEPPEVLQVQSYRLTNRDVAYADAVATAALWPDPGITGGNP